MSRALLLVTYGHASPVQTEHVVVIVTNPRRSDAPRCLRAACGLHTLCIRGTRYCVGMPLCARIVQTKWSQDVPELVTVAKRPSPSATAFTWEPRHVAVAVFDGSDAATSGSSPAGSAGTRCSLPRAATATLIVHDVLDDVELFRSTPCKLYKDGAFYFHAPRFRAPGRYRMVFQVACKGLAVAPCVTEHHVVLQRASADPGARGLQASRAPVVAYLPLPVCLPPQLRWKPSPCPTRPRCGPRVCGRDQLARDQLARDQLAHSVCVRTRAGKRRGAAAAQACAQEAERAKYAPHAALHRQAAHQCTPCAASQESCPQSHRLPASRRP